MISSRPTNIFILYFTIEINNNGAFRYKLESFKVGKWVVKQTNNNLNV